jgi:cytochrome b561
MTRYLNRRIVIGAAFSLVAFALFAFANRSYHASLRDVQYFNGWILAAFFAAMLLLPLRKSLPVLPLGRVRNWLQIHYYLGYLTLGVFLVHTKFRLPNAPVEWILWGLFCTIAFSGMIGGLLSKLIPRRLEEHGNRVLFEQIPSRRAALAEQAEAVGIEAARSGKATSLTTLYSESLFAYFSGPSNTIAHLRMSDRPLRRILGELRSIDRYLDDDGKMLLKKMEDLVRAKNNLDFQQANAGILKTWLFFHVPPSYAAIALIVLHVIIAYGFSTGIS